MKTARSKHIKWLLLLVVILISIAASSCKSNIAKSRFEYALHDFDAEITGTINGDKVSAKLQSRPSAGAESYKIVLSFDAPESLCGVVLSYRADGTGEARLGDIILREFNPDGFFEPFLPLLYSGEVASITRIENGSTVVSVQNERYDLEYVFLKGCEYPQSIKGTVEEREIELFVQSLDFVP